jgi:hypothetical protein
VCVCVYMYVYMCVCVCVCVQSTYMCRVSIYFINAIVISEVCFMTYRYAEAEMKCRKTAEHCWPVLGNMKYMPI